MEINHFNGDGWITVPSITGDTVPEHRTTVSYAALSGRYAVCSCGWRGPDRFGGLHEPGKWEAEVDGTDHINEQFRKVR